MRRPSQTLPFGPVPDLSCFPLFFPLCDLGVLAVQFPASQRMVDDWFGRRYWVRFAFLLGARPADETFRSHVVVCQEGDAAEAGREVLRRGGNAVDAAVATAFALAVTHPAAGNIGGGGFLVAYLAESREVVTVDFREIGPEGVDRDDVPRPGRPADARPPRGAEGGGRAGDGPGARAGPCEVGQGRPGPTSSGRPRSWPATGSRSRRRSPASLNGQLFATQARRRRRRPRRPRARRATGWPTSPPRSPPSASPTAPHGARATGSSSPTWPTPSTGSPTQGPDEFYTGETARKIVAHMEKLGGLITLDDLAAYQAKVRPADPRDVTRASTSTGWARPPRAGS